MLIATSGHVDHGKTRLVHALTGVDTDRLPEEKARGLTIDLGFAYVTGGAGERLGFVDVPGHEKFIRNMIAGVPAIDFALLVVAADDGPMPQTREHLAILDLLGIDHGAIVISKIDRVDAARVDAVRDELESVLSGSALAGAPVFAVSAQSGDGVERLRDHLLAEASSHAARSSSGRFRLAVDRVFSPPGSGLVVTGAIYDGVVEVGDRVALMPSSASLRVRGIERAGSQVEHASSGERAAINLSGRGIGIHDVARGDWLVAEPAPGLSAHFDAVVSLLAGESHELKHWSAVHVHHGAGFFTARVSPLEGAPIVPGGHGWAQIVLERETHLVHGDRVLLRDASGQRTIGGARVVEPFAPRRVRDRARRLRLLAVLDTPRLAEALAGALHEASDGVDVERFAETRNVDAAEVRSALESMDTTTLSTRHGERVLATERVLALDARARAMLAAVHEAQPERVGVARDEVIRAMAGDEPGWLADARLEQLVRDATIARDGAVLRLPEHEPAMPPRDAARLRRLRDVLTPQTLKAPSVSELAQRMNLTRDEMLEFLKACERRGQMVRVADNRYFDPGALVALAHVAKALAESQPQGRFDAKAFRDASEIGRNLTIDVLEFFDRKGFTRRLGDLRVVVKSPDALFT